MVIGVHFTVGDTRARRHDLDFTGFNDAIITDVIAVTELAW